MLNPRNCVCVCVSVSGVLVLDYGKFSLALFLSRFEHRPWRGVCVYMYIHIYTSMEICMYACIRCLVQLAWQHTRRPTPFSAYEHTRHRHSSSWPAHRTRVPYKAHKTQLYSHSQYVQYMYTVYTGSPTLHLSFVRHLAFLIWSFVPLQALTPSYFSKRTFSLSLCLSFKSLPSVSLPVVVVIITYLAFNERKLIHLKF